jgi:hypothetical protein
MRTSHTVVFCILTHGFPSAQNSLHFDWKWPPPAVESHQSHTAGHCFSPYKCIPGFRSRRNTSVSMLEEFDTYEVVFRRPAEHSCMNVFSRIQSCKANLCGRYHFRKLRSMAVKIGNMKIYRQFFICENFTFHWCRLYVGILCIFLVFYRRKCINQVRESVQTTHYFRKLNCYHWNVI